MVIKPVKDYVLVKVDAPEEKSQGGILLVSAEPVVKSSGVVMAVGDSAVITVKVGDHVLMDKGMGRRFDMPVVRINDAGLTWSDTEEYILIPFYDLVALLED
jgi:co-chaperonin GroES (HSP10)